MRPFCEQIYNCVFVVYLLHEDHIHCVILFFVFAGLDFFKLVICCRVRMYYLGVVGMSGALLAQV